MKGMNWNYDGSFSLFTRSFSAKDGVKIFTREKDVYKSQLYILAHDHAQHKNLRYHGNVNFYEYKSAIQRGSLNSISVVMVKGATRKDKISSYFYDYYLHIHS